MDSIGPIMIVEDDKLTSISLSRNLRSWGYEVNSAVNGVEALEKFIKQPVSLVLTDWMMPEMDGVELCKKLRGLKMDHYIYIIFLTGKIGKKDTVKALEAGADDYISKPFNPEELQARIRAAERVIMLEKVLREKNEEYRNIIWELENSHKTIKKLKSLMPICMYCRKIRNDDDYWQQLDEYIHQQSNVDFTHGICPTCYEERCKPVLDEAEREAQKRAEKPQSDEN